MLTTLAFQSEEPGVDGRPTLPEPSNGLGILSLMLLCSYLLLSLADFLHFLNRSSSSWHLYSKALYSALNFAFSLHKEIVLKQGNASLLQNYSSNNRSENHALNSTLQKLVLSQLHFHGSANSQDAISKAANSCTGCTLLQADQNSIYYKIRHSVHSQKCPASL